MISLVCMAMNPNLSAEQFKKLSQEYTEARARIFDQAFAAAEKLPAEARIEYLGHVLSLMACW